MRRGGRLLVLTVLYALSALGVASRSAAQQLDTVVPKRELVPRPDTVRLTIGEAARLGAERNAVVAAARFQTAQTRAQKREVSSAFWPQLSGHIEDGERTENLATFGATGTLVPGAPQVIGPIRTIDLRGLVSQTIFDWGVIQQLRQAGAVVDASRVQEDVVRDSVADVVLVAYVQALLANAAVVVNQEDVALAEELLRVARAQFTAGVAVRLDVTRAQAQLALTRGQLVAAVTAAEQAQLTLRRVLSLPLETVVVLRDTLLTMTIPPPPTEAAVDTAFAERSDLRELAAQIHAGERQVSAIRAQRVPTFGFTGDNGWNGTSWNNLPRTYTWNFEISIPIFSGRLRHNQIEAEKAAVRALESLRLDLHRQVAFAVRSALLQWQNTVAQVAANREALVLAEEVVTEAQARFRAGVASNSDVITAALLLGGARINFVQSLANYLAARLALASAQGIARRLP